MEYFGSYNQSDEYRREELLRKIGRAVEAMSLQELEALYYELSTKGDAND